MLSHENRNKIVSGKIGEELVVASMKTGALAYGMKNRLARLSLAVKQELYQAVERRARRRAEEILREIEENYRNLFENASDGLVTFALDGTITRVNREFETMLGRPREELIGQHYSKFVTSSSFALAEELTRQALAGEKPPSTFE